MAHPILDRDAKRATLRALSTTLGLRTASCLAVGDGANDLSMLRAAGAGVAFRAKPVVTAEVSNHLDFADLRAVLFAQGYTGEMLRE